MRLSARWGLPWITPRSMVGSMVSIPLPPALGATPADAAMLKNRLLADDGIEAQILSIDGALWWRLSAQAYNDADDVEHFTQALARRPAGG